MEGIRYKATMGFVRLIDGFLGVLGSEGIVFRDVRFRDELLVSGETINTYFYNLDRSIAVPNRIRLTAEWLLDLLKERLGEIKEFADAIGITKDEILKAVNQLYGGDNHE